MSLTKEIILAAANDMLRRHGPAKATVVDVAQALRVSHGSIYRFFPTKAALREAVVGAWVNRIADGLEKRSFDGPAVVRLRAWFQALLDEKQAQRAESPELFEAFRNLSVEEPATISAYKERLASMIGALLSQGIETGEFRTLDPVATASALLNATVRFHHPYFATEWDTPGSASDFETLWTVLVQGISSERTFF